jgi:threonine aldolase
VKRRVDLRSDTVTQPDAAMRRAMADAEVGDDVYGEDPNVNALEGELADRLGFEAGLFLPTGTQSNLAALLSHCGRGDEYIAGESAHTYRFEGGGAAVLGGIQPQTVPVEPDGSLDLGRVEAAIKPDDPHFARTRLLCLENTQAGRPLDAAYTRSARALCDRRRLTLHLDGARLFNAAIALEVEAAELASACHSVSVCLSKGLGAPAGSVLVGARDFIAQARRWRKVLGGGMRQAGVLAAAGRYALRHHVERLVEDHRRAAMLATALGDFPALTGHVRVATNMVFVDLEAARMEALRAHLERHGVVIRGGRWVVHLDIDDRGIDRVIAATGDFFAA